MFPWMHGTRRLQLWLKDNLGRTTAQVHHGSRLFVAARANQVHKVIDGDPCKYTFITSIHDLDTIFRSLVMIVHQVSDGKRIRRFNHMTHGLDDRSALLGAQETQSSCCLEL